MNQSPLTLFIQRNFSVVGRLTSQRADGQGGNKRNILKFKVLPL